MATYRQPHQSGDEEKYAGRGQGFESSESSPPARRKSTVNFSSDDQDPFHGDEQSGGIQYRTLTWWQAAAIMVAETISLGILSLPSALDRVGMEGGILLILGLGALATYSGYVLGQFKLAYPYIHTFADAMEIVMTPIGMGAIAKEFFGACQVIFMIFTMGSHLLTWTIMLNTLTGPVVCTIVWGVIGMIIFWACDIPRTMKNLSFFSIASFLSIISAVLITMIDVGVVKQGHGVATTSSASFPKAFNSASNVVFAFAGHVSFFSFISELRDPRDFPKALYTLQAADISIYLVAAVVIYYYTGDEVVSPALGSSSPEVVKKIAWGIAIPTIVIAGVIYGHVASKYVYVRLFRGTPYLTQKGLFTRGSLVWLAITLTGWVLAWIIAESIPVFNDLLSLITALFATWFTYGLSGVFWLFLNWGQWTKGPRKIFLMCLNFFLVTIGFAICGIGLYASGYSIHADASSGSGSWSCAWNGQGQGESTS